MGAVFAQSDTAQDCTVGVFCSGATLGVTNKGRKAVEGGSPGSTQQTITLGVPNGIQQWACWNFEIVPGADFSTWAAGTYTIQINVTSGGGPNTTLQEVHICRVNSSCSNVASLGSTTGIFQAVDTPGVYTVDVSGSAVASPAPTDKILVVVVFRDEVDSNSNVGITPDRNVTTPLQRGTIVPKVTGYNRRRRIA